MSKMKSPITALMFVNRLAFGACIALSLTATAQAQVADDDAAEEVQCEPSVRLDINGDTPSRCWQLMGPEKMREKMQNSRQGFLKSIIIADGQGEIVHSGSQLPSPLRGGISNLKLVNIHEANRTEQKCEREAAEDGATEPAPFKDPVVTQEFVAEFETRGTWTELCGDRVFLRRDDALGAHAQVVNISEEGVLFSMDDDDETSLAFSKSPEADDELSFRMVWRSPFSISVSSGKAAKKSTRKKKKPKRRKSKK